MAIREIGDKLSIRAPLQRHPATKSLWNPQSENSKSCLEANEQTWIIEVEQLFTRDEIINRAIREEDIIDIGA